jgi:hypothetical protein
MSLMLITSVEASLIRTGLSHIYDSLLHLIKLYGFLEIQNRELYFNVTYVNNLLVEIGVDFFKILYPSLRNHCELIDLLLPAEEFILHG